MTDSSRRTFLKNIGLYSMCLALAKAKEGIPSPLPEDDTEKKIPTFQPPDSHARLLIAGVGEAGSLVLNALTEKDLRHHYSPDGNFDGESKGILNFLRFSHGDDHLRKFHSNCHLIFLLGDAADPDFQTARDIVLKSSASLVLTFIPSATGKTVQLKADEKEALLLIDPDNYLSVVAAVIEDFCSAYLLPNIVGIDLADAISILAGSIGTAGFVDGDLSNHPELFGQFLCQNRHALKNADGLWATFSSDHREIITMDYMTTVSELIYDQVGENMEIIWSVPKGQKLNTPYRASCIWVKKIT